ncbi:5-formyltetrahydrofolate cyclo-ligase [uncultured Ruthenibacterium sp.]|mgnify:CR=1 FL=1|uniref:5-formyltetrahydrofolate cyclo-ligase n=1 Tax=uncultured Ruthenibacterium sp. TaxID=1905347 RepID=UPI00349E84D0
MSLAEQKRAIRAQMRIQVNSLSSTYTALASEKICQLLWEMPAYQNAKTVFCFVGTSREIDTRLFLERVLLDQKRLCVPLCTGKGVMEARAIASLQTLCPGAMGILEPPKNALCVPPQEIDVCVVPCLAATRQGQRLGYGGGYYDRFLPHLRANAACILVCREKMLMSSLPVESHDICFANVVTEKTENASRV